MDIEDWIVIGLLFIGLPLAVGLYGKYRRKWEIDDTIRYVAITEMYCTIIFLIYICFFEETIPQNVVNKSTVLGINLAIGAIIIAYFAQMSQKRTVTDFHHDIDEIRTNSLYIMQSTTDLTTHLNHLEESQKALADQIQSLKDSILAAEPSDESHDDEDSENG